jgi:hypothetical protein
MRFFLLATTSTMVFLSALHPAYSMESDSAAASTSLDAVSGTPHTPDTPNIGGADAHSEGSPAGHLVGGGGGATAEAAPKRGVAEQVQAEFVTGLTNYLTKSFKNKIPYSQRLMGYKSSDYHDFYNDAILTVRDSKKPELRRAFLNHLEKLAENSSLGSQKDSVTSMIADEHHSMNTGAVPVVTAKEHTPTATNLVAGITAAMSQGDVDRMSQEIIANVGNQLGNPADMAHDVDYYHKLREAAAAENVDPQVQQAISEHGGKQLALARSKPLAQGSEPGLYTRDESGVMSPAPESEINKLAKVFQKNKAASGGQSHVAFMIDINKMKAAATLKDQSLDHATKTHDTVDEHATHMNGVIQAMRDHLDKNHGNPQEAVTALAHIQEAHRQVLDDVKQKTANSRIMTAAHAQTNLDKLNAAGVHLMSLPNDHGEDGHKAQLQKQHESLRNAVQDHLTVMTNHQEIHINNASAQAVTSGFLRSNNVRLPTVSDASSSSPSAGDGGGGGGGAPTHADPHTAGGGAAGHTPATTAHETHTAPHEAHTAEHHSSGHP